MNFTTPKDAQQGSAGAMGDRFNERIVDDYHSGEPINKPSARGQALAFKRKEGGKISMIDYLMKPLGDMKEVSSKMEDDNKSKQTLMERRK